MALALVGLGGIGGLLAVAVASFSILELERFALAEARRNALIYSAGQRLSAGVHVRLIDLAGVLGRLGYTEVSGSPAAPGHYRRAEDGWDIALRGGEGRADGAPGRWVRLEMDGPRIARVLLDGQAVESVELEGEVLTDATDQSGEEHRPIRLGDEARLLVNAVMAAEDARFPGHPGLDARSLARAAWANARAGRIRQGGSTITQQLIKLRLLTPERTLARKLREVWLAALVEWRYSKRQILEAYLNEVYLGQRGALAIRGVGAAARAYFGKDPARLTAGEAALLAGMLCAPNTYSPAVNPARARERRDAVLARMRALGMLDAAAHAQARDEPVRALAEPGPGQAAPYFADHVRQEIERRWDENALRDGRIARVLTTLDPALQRFAEEAIARGLDRLETRTPSLRRWDPRARMQAALVAMDPATGAIRALVGGRDYQQSQFNRAVHGRRQPGSAFKPFVYLTALRARAGGAPITAISRVDDSPLTVRIDGKSWSPRNDGGRYEGRVTVRRALERSLNTATVRLAQAVGLRAVAETARAMGITADMPPLPALALGAFEVSPVELARAYAPFANRGVRPAAATAVRAVYQPGGGHLLPRHDAASRPVISAAEAYLMTSLLGGVVRSGTGVSLRSYGISGEVAGKTGTTNEGRDAWFIGYSSRLLAVVWVGFDQDDAHGLAGAQAALPIWGDFMKQALDAYPAPPFAVPDGISVAAIDPSTGRSATPHCPLVIREVFLAGTDPLACDEHGGPLEPARDPWDPGRPQQTACLGSAASAVHGEGECPSPHQEVQAWTQSSS
jgi:penicillin-binding protein 1B